MSRYYSTEIVFYLDTHRVIVMACVESLATIEIFGME